MNKKLTFIIPLLDLSNFTKEFLYYNIFDDYNYIFADGSIGNENSKIFNDLKAPNIEYIRFNPDLNFSDYFKKMYEASKIVKTKYVMTCDNDDFINPIGINKILIYIKNNKDIDICSSFISHIFYKKNKFRFIEFSNSLRQYKKINSANIINKEFFINYRHLWYAIFKTSSFEAVWKKSSQNNLSNMQYQELFVSLFSYSKFQFDFINTSHYSRRVNTENNGANNHQFDYAKIDLDIEKIYSSIKEYVSNEKVFKSSLKNFFNKKKIRKQKNLILKILHKIFLKYYSYRINNKIILFLLYFKKYY